MRDGRWACCECECDCDCGCELVDELSGILRVSQDGPACVIGGFSVWNCQLDVVVILSELTMRLLLSGEAAGGGRSVASACATMYYNASITHEHGFFNNKAG